MKYVWTELQIHYHEENKDSLILQLLRPLIVWMQPQVEQVFFVRHWQRGSHLRLRILAEPERFESTIQPELESRVASYLKSQPSTRVIDQIVTLEFHQRLALEELEEGELLPFYPNNSWHFATYNRRTHLMPESVADLIEKFYSQTNGLVFEMLKHVKAGRDRVNLALDLMIATLQAVSPDIVSRFISYRSHAELFIVKTEDDNSTRERFKRVYQANAKTMIERLNRILTGIAQHEQTVPFLKEWTALIVCFSNQIHQAIESGNISLEPYQANTPRSKEYLEGEVRLRRSAFHAMQLDDKGNMEARSRDIDFNTFRLIVNLQYLHLNRIGLRPHERSLLAYLIAEAVEERFQVSAYDLAKTHTYNPAVSGGLA